MGQGRSNQRAIQLIGDVSVSREQGSLGTAASDTGIFVIYRAAMPSVFLSTGL